MKSKTHVKFLLDVGRKKPNSIINKDTSCPFCNRQGLEEILDEQYPFILVKNKYTVLEDSFQTVLIETDDCEANISTYDKAYMRKLLRFGIRHWKAMEDSGDFESVIFFKNHGHYSGGTIKHSHMQIIGFKHLDYKETIEDQDFEGIVIEKYRGFEVNISTKPRASFTEFNIIIDNMDEIDLMADSIRKLIYYILNCFTSKCESFNMFFYSWKGKIICKIVPRFVASPLFIGYSIMQVSSEIEHMAEKLRVFKMPNIDNIKE